MGSQNEPQDLIEFSNKAQVKLHKNSRKDTVIGRFEE